MKAVSILLESARGVSRTSQTAQNTWPEMRPKRLPILIVRRMSAILSIYRAFGEIRRTRELFNLFIVGKYGLVLHGGNLGGIWKIQCNNGILDLLGLLKHYVIFSTKPTFSMRSATVIIQYFRISPQRGKAFDTTGRHRHQPGTSHAYFDGSFRYASHI